jgi:exodeoxyribonuclease VII small subunit
MAKNKISYDDALKEIEDTLEKIETGNLGVDELADQVARVTGLLKECRQRLNDTEKKIGRILDEEAEGAGES